MTEAERAAKALEHQRVRLLASATMTLFDKDGAQLVVLSHSFYVHPKTNLALGEEYERAEVSELAGMTLEIGRRVKTAQLSTKASRLTVSKVEEPTTASRTWELRLSPFVKS